MSKTLLDIHNLSISYDNKKSFILRDISFSLSSWEILSVIGKNGTGKSSLLKAIAGIQKIHSWKIKKHTKNISYVPQKLELDKIFPLLVEEFFYIFNTSISQSDITKYLKLFNSEKLRNRNIHDLSGGEYQKILIINSLLSNPDILLLDEPTSWIDVVWEELFYKNITEIKKIFPKLAIVLVSHNLSLVYKNASRVICLHENNFCCHGTPQELSKNSDIQNIFWEYLRPYEHQPHALHHHTH
jgi:zinc transport system ATP-binding protein